VQVKELGQMPERARVEELGLTPEQALGQSLAK
jgi:hypothetical protein